MLSLSSPSALPASSASASCIVSCEMILRLLLPLLFEIVPKVLVVLVAVEGLGSVVGLVELVVGTEVEEVLLVVE